MEKFLMHKLHTLLRYANRAYARYLSSPPSPKSMPWCVNSPDASYALISGLLNAPDPCMIARFGGVEMSCLYNYVGVCKGKSPPLEYVRGKSPPWWWDDKVLTQMHWNAGFFPLEIREIEKFCELMLDRLVDLDLLGTWLPEELYFDEKLSKCKRVDLELLNPFFSKVPWTRSLEGKTVLVVHPFASTIESQYKRKHQIFPNGLLPEFELKTIKAVQSIAGQKSDFDTWFDALRFMEDQISSQTYDICLIGCGAYGFPLASHVKRAGKKAIHLGGTLQLLFGIRGTRWETSNYHPLYKYSELMNESWVRPKIDEVPEKASSIEGGCYW